MTNLIELHKRSKNNRDDLMKSTSVGCFYCLKHDLTPCQIVDWCGPFDEVSDMGMTGICPSCGIDSLIGDFSGVKIELPILAAMHSIWFSEIPIESF